MEVIPIYYIKHRTCRRVRRIRLFTIIAIVLALFIFLNIQLRSVIKPMLDNSSKNIYTTAVNEAVKTLLEGSQYGQFVKLSLGADGKPTSIETDTLSVNRFKSEVSECVLDALEHLELSPSSVPLGTLTGIDLLVGTGPDVKLRLSPRGGITTELYSSLEQAGINQTRHTISCKVTSDVYAMIPGMSDRLTLTTTVLIAESILVGEVPESFTYVVGDKTDTIGRIFDYGDPYGIGN